MNSSLGLVLGGEEASRGSSRTNSGTGCGPHLPLDDFNSPKRNRLRGVARVVRFIRPLEMERRFMLQAVVIAWLERCPRVEMIKKVLVLSRMVA